MTRLGLLVVVIAFLLGCVATPSRAVPSFGASTEPLGGAPHEAAGEVVGGRSARLPFVASVAAPLLTGWATYYTDPRKSGLYAAAGPALRNALGSSWRGQSVTVCAASCVTVRLSDWCACGPRHGTPTLIDVSPAAFSRLAPLSAGIVRVTITLGGRVLTAKPVPTAPPTDV